MNQISEGTQVQMWSVKPLAGIFPKPENSNRNLEQQIVISIIVKNRFFELFQQTQDIDPMLV